MYRRWGPWACEILTPLGGHQGHIGAAFSAPHADDNLRSAPSLSSGWKRWQRGIDQHWKPDPPGVIKLCWRHLPSTWSWRKGDQQVGITSFTDFYKTNRMNLFGSAWNKTFSVVWKQMVWWRACAECTESSYCRHLGCLQDWLHHHPM